MKIRRGIYNIVFGIGGQILTIALGLVIPRLLIVNIGSEANGLVSFVNQMLVYAGLFEAGIGAASLQALYGPVTRNDKREINSILAAVSRDYKKAGIYYLIFVFIFAVICPFVITSTYSGLSIFFVVIFSGMGGGINFLSQAKYNILLRAEGKIYIISNVTTIIGIMTSIGKIVLLTYGFDVVGIQFLYFVICIIQMLIYEMYIKYNYKWVDLNVAGNDSALEQKNAVLIHQFSGLIFSSTDIIILSVMCDLKVTSVYSLYSLITSIVQNIIAVINNGVVFMLGQLYSTDKEEYLKFQSAYETYYIMINFSLYTILSLLLTPFIKLYTQGITDITYIDNYLSFLFITVNILMAIKSAAANAIAVSGHFRQTQYMAYIEPVINMLISIIGTYFLGIYGVLLGSIMAVIYRVYATILYADKNIFKKNSSITYKKTAINIMVFIFVHFFYSNLNFSFNTYPQLIISGFVMLITTVPMYIFFNSIFNRDDFRYVKKMINSRILHKEG